MRRFLLWMMICLLPLRLWAGDAMAVQHVPLESAAAIISSTPATHPCHAAEAASAHALAHTTQHSNADLDDHAKAQDSAHGIEQSGQHSGACGDCSVCHGPLAGLSVPSWASRQQAGALPEALGWNALSASPLPQLKPPRA